MTTTDPIPAQTGTTDAILPTNARAWVYRIAIILGAVLFVVAIVLKVTGHNVIGGVVIDPETGIVALVLAGLGALAHANLTTGPGILEALETECPIVAEVIADGEKVITRVTTAAKANPELTAMLVKDLRDEAKRLGIKGYSGMTKAELVAAIKAATKGGA